MDRVTLFGFCRPLFFVCNNCFMTTSQMQSRVYPAMPERSRVRQAQEHQRRMANDSKVTLIYYWLATLLLIFVGVLLLQRLICRALTQNGKWWQLIYYWLATAPQLFLIVPLLELLILEHFPIQANVPVTFAIMIIFESYPLMDIVVILLNHGLRNNYNNASWNYRVPFTPYGHHMQETVKLHHPRTQNLNL